jgi:hypothetical protein
MENILGTPPPEPPAGVPMLEDQKQLTGTLREQMEQHRADPNCAVCHRKMDQLGFAFENFDAVGAWRTRDGEYAVDASGKLPDGRSFDGPAELKQLLKRTSRDEFARCMAEKMLTYAIGRGVEPFDRPAVDAIVEKLIQDDYRFTTLVQAVAASDPFNKRSKR